MLLLAVCSLFLPAKLCFMPTRTRNTVEVKMPLP